MSSESPKTFIAVIGGVEYTCKTSMGAINKAQRMSGANLLNCVISDDYSGLLQGLITVAMQNTGVQITFDEVGELCNFHETLLNSTAMSAALWTDIADADEVESDSKNAPTGKVKKKKKKKKKPTPSHGKKSNNSPMDTSD